MVPGLLSITLPNYNHSAYVAGQIGGILSQGFRDFELIVIDDASTDNSVAVIEQAIAGDPRVRFFRNESNLGVVKTNEKARALARGEFYFFTAADDRILPGFLEKSMSALRQAPQAGICFTVMAWLDANGTTARPMPMRLIPSPAYLTPEQFCDVICGEHITGHTSVLRAAAFQQAFPPMEDFDRLRWHSDWFVSTVVACRHGCCHIPEPLVAIRQEGGNYGLGMYDWARQQDVILTAIRLLKSEAYRDVLPYFAQGGLFSGLPHVGRTVLAHPEVWDVETLMLAQKPLVDWALERAQRQRAHWQQQQPAAAAAQGFSGLAGATGLSGATRI